MPARSLPVQGRTSSHLIPSHPITRPFREFRSIARASGEQKSGTADGARIARAELTLSVTGFGNCKFGILSPIPGAYDPVGTLKLEWLDANGDTIKGVKPTSAFLRMGPLTPAVGGPVPHLVNLFSIGEGIVTKGLGIGATVRMPITISLDTDLDSPWGNCASGDVVVPPGVPPLPPAKPLEAIAMEERPSVEIVFPDTSTP